MLGLGRLAYSLATNRQIPSARRPAAPSAAARRTSRSRWPRRIAFVLALPHDIEFLAGIFAFGAMLAFTIAHVSVIVLRFREPDRRAPSGCRCRSAWGAARCRCRRCWARSLSVVGLGQRASCCTRARASSAGSGWCSGIALYVVYRQGQGKSLTKRFTIPAEALQERAEAEYGSILVPVFGEQLDDDIVGTAGRLAAEEAEEGEGGAVLEALYVFEVPMSLPIDARVPEERISAAKRALARAKEVGEEYEGVEVATAMVRGPHRRAGDRGRGEAARGGGDRAGRRGAQPRSAAARCSAGAAGSRDRFVGETTRYVVEKAPCRVILTAPPAGEEGRRARAIGLPRHGARVAPHVRADRRLRPGGLVDRQVDARRGPRGLRARRGPRGDRAARARRRTESWEELRRLASPWAPRSRSTRCSRPASSSADAFVASTDGDNTNLVIAQIAQRRFDIERVVVRVLDPARAKLVRRAGPADRLPDPDRDRAARGRRARPDPLRGGLRLDVRR